MSIEFSKFADAVWRKGKYKAPEYGRIIALDPGETTGWSLWVLAYPQPPAWQLQTQGQLHTPTIEDGLKEYTALLDEYKPDFVVYERYAVYSWKSSDHSWSDVVTLRLIGQITTLCLQRKIPFTEQTAQQAKHFGTDTFLKQMNLYNKGQRHARDSIRHGVYYILFGNKNKCLVS